MTLLSQQELQTLIHDSSSPCVSIYLPTHTAGAEIQQDPIRLKNLLSKAQAQLTEQGQRTSEAEQLLAPAWALLDEGHEEFWRHQRHGLALFLSANSFRYYRMPLSFQELAVVSDRFHLKPLMPLLTGDGTFYVLAISQNQLRLWQASRDTMDELPLDDLPESLAEVLQYDDPEKQLQFHSGDRGGDPIYHGQGVGTTDDKTNILRYCQAIDRGINDLLKDQQVPLVLAGVEYILSIYREANSYSNLLEAQITGNPDQWQASELHQQAWAIVEPYFQQAQKLAVEQYRQLITTEQTTAKLAEILPAAHAGQIDTLFVQAGIQQWGSFDPQTRQLEQHSDQHPGDEDLLDLAAVYTLSQSGKVYSIPASDMPERSTLAAATLRYPLFAGTAQKAQE